MSDYTPTTEEVRDGYASWSDAYPEFDCLDSIRWKIVNWLAGFSVGEEMNAAANQAWVAGFELGKQQSVLSVHEAKADAWEEGYAHGNADAFTEARLNRDNPYRQGETE